MRIGIDISQIVYEGTGVATYTRNLVENLLLLDQKNEYFLFGSSLRKKEILSKFTSAKKVVLPIPPTLLSFLWNDLHILSIDNFIGKTDIIHSSDWTQPPTTAKKVTTIHDLIVYKFPQFSRTSTGFRKDSMSLSPNIVAIQKKRLEQVKKECDLIIVDSIATKKDCEEILKIPSDRMRVVYLAANDRFGRFGKLPVSEKETEIEKVRKKYSLNKGYVLAVGTREPRKNLEKLIEAFSRADSKNTDLVIAGKFGWGSESSKFNVQNLKLLGFVPDEDMPALYAGAKVYAFPSLYEGFGVPILEAMGSGCPVLTSNVSSMPEVGGEAAIYIDPIKTDEIAQKLSELVKFSDSEREQMIRKGFIQAEKFSWKKTATETLKVYEEVVRI